MSTGECVFCKIIRHEIPADIVAESAGTLTFLDLSPVFSGHLLIVPKRHVETVNELRSEELGPFFEDMRRGASAVETGLGAQGAFLAVNHKVSQTVPHLHAHVIPRSKGDGMKGFFWPRRHYRDDEHRREIAEKLRAAYR